MTYNVMTSGRSQVIMDEAALANLQQELARRGIDVPANVLQRDVTQA